MAIQGYIKVSTGDLRTASGNLKKLLKTMQGKFDSIKKTIEGTENYWVGDGGDAHRLAYTEKQSMIEEMFSRYQEQVNDLLEIAGVYEQYETAVEDAANELPSSNL